MNEQERTALSAALQVNWAPTAEDIWAPLEAHVDGLNDAVARTVMAAYGEAESSGASPVGVVVTGANGAGKSHMVRWVRTQVQQREGYFLPLVLRTGREFWPNVVHSLVAGLRRGENGGENQLRRLVRRTAAGLDVSQDIRAAVTGSTVDPASLDSFVRALRRSDRLLGAECQYTLRALVMLASGDMDVEDLGESFLTGGEITSQSRAYWGLSREVKPARQIVSELSRLLALTGPALLAVDQIDALLDYSDQAADPLAETALLVKQGGLPEQVGSGLMELRETMVRTVTVVACLPGSWDHITSRSGDAVGDRFRRTARLDKIPSAAVGQALAEAHLTARYARVAGFQPPFPSWPVEPAAFADAPRFTPRGLLTAIDNHVRSCLDNDNLVLLSALGEQPAIAVRAHLSAESSQASPQLAVLDAQFGELVTNADVSAALESGTEDAEMPGLLRALLWAWIREQGPDGAQYDIAPPTGPRPPMHATLFRVLNDETEAKQEWTFRSLVATHWKAVEVRVNRAKVLSGVTPGGRVRAYLLRPANWTSGPRTIAKVDEFVNAGGELLPLEPGDLRTGAALAQLIKTNPTGLAEWLRLRRPAGRSALLRAVFGDPDIGTTAMPDPLPPDIDVPAHNRDQRDVLPLGTDLDTGLPVRVPLESLRKHTVIFAGSGSGKTVLIRRIVEECALQGVSSIVLDPNNDLARLGDAWPEPPNKWGPGDAAAARRYLDNSDVVIWTPRRNAGRPLSFQPLPDFAAVRDDPDELDLALDTAVAALAPRGKIDGGTAKAERGRAVLRKALEYFAQHTIATRLEVFLDLLADLPEDAGSLAKATTIAADLAETLRAATINDPLFGGSGTPLDPGVLLTPSPGKHARVSVISLFGLTSNAQRQSFVNQLQMALFAWIKRNPAGDRPLGGLFVMDEAQTLAPSGGITACTESTLALASQARKYGLGLIFATQAPKGIHNRIVGNAATQFYGFLNSPVQIAAARELAQAKGSAVLDISRLNTGEFYVTGEDPSFRKIMAPMCLSHHPRSAPTNEEVLSRARSQADRSGTASERKSDGSGHSEPAGEVPPGPGPDRARRG